MADIAERMGSITFTWEWILLLQKRLSMSVKIGILHWLLTAVVRDVVESLHFLQRFNRQPS